MTIYLVDVEHDVHTCPASPQPHAIDTRRTIVHATPGGPCRTPVTIRCGTTIATIACARHEPAERQCGACRTITVEHTVTVRDLGYQGPAHLRPIEVVA